MEAIHKMNLNELKDLGIIAAKRAGDLLNKNKEKEKKVFQELGKDIKLQLDRETENLIREELKPSGIQILGEEYGGDISDEIKWVVDPIDGTANYFRGLDQCCISIALMDGNECLIGIIYNFNNNDLYSASEGNGAYLNDLQIHVSKISKRNQAIIATGFPVSETVKSSLEFIELDEWKKVRMFGSAALSSAYVASGKCDYYSEKGVYLWDFAAGICLVKEAGGSANYQHLGDHKYIVKFSNNLL